jgi:hypothetical protein
MVRIISSVPGPALVMEEITDPVEVAKSQAHWEQAKRNIAWLKTHADEVYSTNRGKCICIAAEQLFVADTPEAAVALARAAHPQEDGFLFVPKEAKTLIYAHRRRVVALQFAPGTGP